MAISSYNCVLKWGESEGALTKKVDIKDFPDLIGKQDCRYSKGFEYEQCGIKRGG